MLLGSTPPTEFLIFAAGSVETSKGTFLFDGAAASAVLSAHSAQGNELMVDYDHASITSTSADPALASRAAGWFDISMRNGELWAVNVRWTPAAFEALQNKEWRYMSPAFETDPEGRITSLLNVALTNLPATKHLQPLMAASQGDVMDPAQLPMIAEAMGLGADATVEDILAMIGSMMKKIQDAAAGDGDPEDKAEAPEGDPAAEAAPPADPAMQAASKRLLSLTGRASVGEAMGDVEAWRAGYLELSAGRAEIEKSKRNLEDDERVSLTRQLVEIGSETPATAWKDALAKTPKPCERLAKEPIDSLRKRVALLAQTKGARGAAPVVPSGELSPEELALCAEMKCDPKVFAANKARRDAARTARTA